MNQHLKALIVDDDHHSRLSLASMLAAHFPEVNVVGAVGNCADARQVINTNAPDLVFLDISMPGENGFDLLASYPERKFHVVFVTGHEEFVLRALRASAVDYLLKPLLLDEFCAAVAKVQSLVNSVETEADPTFSFSDLSRTLKAQRIDRITIHHQQGAIVLGLGEILYLEADGNYTMIFTANGRKILSSRTLLDYEKILGPEGFFRIHRAYLVNLKAISSYRNSPIPEVILVDGQRLEVSRRRIPGFTEALDNSKSA